MIIKIRSYDILDDDLNVIESNLSMNQLAEQEEGTDEVVFIVDNGPILKPKKPRI